MRDTAPISQRIVRDFKSTYNISRQLLHIGAAGVRHKRQEFLGRLDSKHIRSRELERLDVLQFDQLCPKEEYRRALTLALLSRRVDKCLIAPALASARSANLLPPPLDSPAPA
jgi:hypothetical protein